MLSRAGKLFALVAAILLSARLTGSASVAVPSTSDGDWATWQKDLAGSRYAAAERRINARNVKNLTLKWAFAYPSPGSPTDNPTARRSAYWPGYSRDKGRVLLAFGI